MTLNESPLLPSPHSSCLLSNRVSEECVSADRPRRNTGGHPTGGGVGGLRGDGKVSHLGKSRASRSCFTRIQGLLTAPRAGDLRSTRTPAPERDGTPGQNEPRLREESEPHVQRQSAPPSSHTALERGRRWGRNLRGAMDEGREAEGERAPPEDASGAAARPPPTQGSHRRRLLRTVGAGRWAEGDRDLSQRRLGNREMEADGRASRAPGGGGRGP